jgi:hypothetical protein
MVRPNRIFIALSLASVVTLVVYIYWAKTRGNTAEALISAAPPIETPQVSPTISPTTDSMPLPAAIEAHATKTDSDSPPHSSGNPQNKLSKQIFFRYNGIDRHYGQLAFVPYEHTSQPRFIDTLSCEAAHVAGGRGICLAADRGIVTTYAAKLFDVKTFRILAQFPLNGVPSRCRMSKDGRLAALTVFVSGHGYASVNFSTQTLLIEVDKGQIIADLEEFKVMRDGQPISNKDFNFWGVTFTPDSRHFYATLSTNRRHYLVKGNIADRSVTVIHDNVECPSLSPNGSHIAYKKRFMVEGRVFWQLHILDLATKGETPLGEKRSVDDQLEWLDKDHVLYTLPETESGSGASTNIWLAAADGLSAPVLFLKKAYSPSVAPLQ